MPGRRVWADTASVTRLAVVVMSLLAVPVMTGVAGAFLLAPYDHESPQLARMYRENEDLKGLQSALDERARRRGRYPTGGQGLPVLVREGELRSLIRDPWGRPYLYRLQNGRGVVLCYGADGAPGGKGVDIDMVSDQPGENRRRLQSFRFWRIDFEVGAVVALSVPAISLFVMGIKWLLERAALFLLRR